MRSDRVLGMKARWALRMFALLLMLALLTLIWICIRSPTLEVYNGLQSVAKQLSECKEKITD